jgi:hypothetical protein
MLVQNSKDGVGGVTSPGPGTVWRVDALSGLQCNTTSTAAANTSTDTSSYALDWRVQSEAVGHKVLAYTTTAAA